MTTKILLLFTCKLCKKDFYCYVIGKYLSCHYHMIHTDGICFYDLVIGEIHNNNIINPLRDTLKCEQCSKSHQLEDYI